MPLGLPLIPDLPAWPLQSVAVLSLLAAIAFLVLGLIDAFSSRKEKEEG